MKQKLVQKNCIRGLSAKDYQMLRFITKSTKNLYNSALYLVKQEYEATEKYLGYNDTWKLLKGTEQFLKLPYDVAQHTLKLLDKNYQSFFKLLKLKKQGKYEANIQTPHFIKRDEYFLAIFTKNHFKIVDNQIRLSLGKYAKKELKQQFVFISLPFHIPQKFNQIRLLPFYKAKYFEIEFVYEVEKIEVDLNYAQYVSIDLGLDNFATCYSTNETPFILEGRGLKSYNRWWNKEFGKLRSYYKKLDDIDLGKPMIHMLVRRRNTIRNYMAQQVNYIIKHCLKNKIGNIIVGDWGDMKRNITLGRKNNEKFFQIPFALFKQKLQYKCAMYGIKLVYIPETYTSQTCANCGVIKKSNRKYRGLYVCKDCSFICNADVNGAINILKRVVPEIQLEFQKDVGNSGVMLTPVRIQNTNFGLPTRKPLILNN